MPDAGMGFFAAAYGGEQHPPGFRLIIHVFGFAAHVQVGAFMGQRRAGAGEFPCFRHRAHIPASTPVVSR